MNVKLALAVIGAIALAAAVSTSAGGQDFNGCSLAGTDFDPVAGGGGTLFRDPNFTNDNCAGGVPDSELYIGPGGTLLGHSHQHEVAPGSDFVMDFNYRAQLNNNSNLQILINGASDNTNAGDAANNGALRLRIGDESRLPDPPATAGQGGLIWDVLGTSDAGFADPVAFNYEALTDGSEMNLNISISGGRFLSVDKQIIGTDAAPVNVLDGVDIGTGMSTASDRVTSFQHLESVILIDDFSLIVNPEPSPVPGDFNGDGIVNTTDYTDFRNNLGTDNALMNDGGLGTPITPAHYDLWKSNFGMSGGSGSAAAVPEPSTLVMLALTLFGFIRGRCGWVRE